MQQISGWDLPIDKNHSARSLNCDCELRTARWCVAQQHYRYRSLKTGDIERAHGWWPASEFLLAPQQIHDLLQNTLGTTRILPRMRPYPHPPCHIWPRCGKHHAEDPKCGKPRKNTPEARRTQTHKRDLSRATLNEQKPLDDIMTRRPNALEQRQDKDKQLLETRLAAYKEKRSRSPSLEDFTRNIKRNRVDGTEEQPLHERSSMSIGGLSTKDKNKRMYILGEETREVRRILRSKAPRYEPVLFWSLLY